MTFALIRMIKTPNLTKADMHCASLPELIPLSAPGSQPAIRLNQVPLPDDELYPILYKFPHPPQTLNQFTSCLDPIFLQRTLQYHTILFLYFLILRRLKKYKK